MFLDFSKNISLSKKQTKLYIIIRIIVLISFIIISIFFSLELLFPTSHFNLTGDFRYRVEKPYKKNNETTFSIVPPREANAVKLNIKLNKNFPKSQNLKIDLYKSYGAFLYDFTLSSQESPPSKNILFSKGDSVFITNDTEKFPFDSSETLLLSGYNFNNLVKAKNTEYSSFKKGNLLSMSSYHIPQTVFHSLDTDKYFLVTKDKKLKKIKKPNSKNIIDVIEKSRTTHITCSLNKKILPLDTYTCTFNLKDISDFPGKRFMFKTNALEPDEIKAIETVFYTKKSKQSFKKRLSQLKNLLNNRS